MTFYWFEFEDGYHICCAGFDRAEMMHAVEKHGELLSKTLA